MGRRSCFALLSALVLLASCVFAPAAAAAETPAATAAAAADTTLLVPKLRTYDGRFADAAGSWCESAIVTCYETGLLSGRTDARFDPSSRLTNAQITVAAARLLSLLTGGKGDIATAGSPWYAAAAAALNAAGGETLKGLVDTLTANPNDACTRANFARAVSGVLDTAKTSLEEINALSALPDTAENAVVALYRAGVLTGSDAYGTFGGDAFLNRGQAAAILARVADSAQRVKLSLKRFDLCADILQLSGDTVLLTADGQAITAELLAPQLVTSLLQWGPSAADKAQADAIRLFCAYDESVFSVARAQGVTLSADEAQTAAASGAVRAGLLGASAAYWDRQSQRMVLNMDLLNAYTAKSEKEGAFNFLTALQTAASSMTAVPAPALKALDLTAVYARAAASPYRMWNGLSQ